MRIYIRRKPSTSPLGTTTKKADFSEWDGIGKQEAIRVPSIKGTSVPDEYTLPFDYHKQKFIVWDPMPVTNPYHNLENPEIGDNWIKDRDWIKSQATLPEQTIAEIKYNLIKGTLTDKRSWSTINESLDASRHTFMEKMRRKFVDTNTFDDANGLSPVEDYIWIKAIIRAATNHVATPWATSLEAAYKNPKCEYYIHDEEKESKATSQRAMPKLEAYGALNEALREYNKEQLYKILSMCYVKFDPTHKVNQDMSETVIRDLLTDFIMKENDKTSVRWQIFVEMTGRFKDKTKSKAFDHEFFIQECIKYGVLHKPKHTDQYYYMNEGKSEAYRNMAGLLALDKKNQDEKEFLEMLESQLKAKLIKV